MRTKLEPTVRQYSGSESLEEGEVSCPGKPWLRTDGKTCWEVHFATVGGQARLHMLRYSV